jgi:hypothetical protein
VSAARLHLVAKQRCLEHLNLLSVLGGPERLRVVLSSSSGSDSGSRAWGSGAIARASC